MAERYIGYGAYNLCFDKLMGKKLSGTGSDFFQYIRDGGWPINLVKVIIFRKSTLEGLPSSRAIPLFNSSGDHNDAFMTHLAAFVDRAAELNFTVQLCVFSFHSVFLKADQRTWEFPENVPPALDPRKLGGDNCTRLRAFFNLDTMSEATKQAQINLVTRLAVSLRDRTNVIWEIANELRMQGCSTALTKKGNCNIIPWLNETWDNIAFRLGPPFPPHTISTGVGNEAVTFNKTRPYDGCAHAAHGLTHYDFHAGQWDALGSFDAGIRAAKRRIATSYQPGHLAVNDDGVPDDQRTTARVKAWAKSAFSRGCSYLSKQEYEPGKRIDTEALDALKAANAAHPLP